MKEFKQKIIVLIKFISDLLYRIQMYICGRKSEIRLFLFTDSRGTEVDNVFKQKNPFYSYLRELNYFDVEYKFCPEKFTSLLDFIEIYEKNNLTHDVLIIHCGIVDFAPRPLSSYKEMLQLKRDFLKSKGWLKYFENRTDSHCVYEGEETLQFISLDFLSKEILPILKNINNLIYVGINPVLNDWDGNYWRKRPICINKQLEHDELMLREIKFCLSLQDWTNNEIKKYTVDNVHYNSSGMKYIGSNLKAVILNLLK